MHDYEGVTLACDDDKQIERTLCAMWGLLSTVTRGLVGVGDTVQIQTTLEQVTGGMVCMIAGGLLLLVMTINTISQSLTDGN